jgi:RNA polymerase sigma-70 factor (ECF subfamily)
MGDEVITALQRLPLVFQTAVILSDIEGQPYDEIAKFMQVPIGTVRSRIHRGRCMLAGMLSGYARDHQAECRARSAEGKAAQRAKRCRRRL